MNNRSLNDLPAINILILAVGKLNFDRVGVEYPLCLTEIDGVSVLERIVETTKSFVDAQYTFVFLESEDQRFHLKKIASLLVPGSNSVQVPELSKGSACTALLAACSLKQEAELIIISANELVDLDLGEVIEEFRSRGLEGGLLTFRSVHPRYSYVRLDHRGFVTEAAQRNPISFYATAGVFWYAKTHLFVEAAKSIIRKDAEVDGSYFLAPTYNELVLKHKNIGVRELDPSKYLPLKTEQQLNYLLGSNLT